MRLSFWAALAASVAMATPAWAQPGETDEASGAGEPPPAGEAPAESGLAAPYPEPAPAPAPPLDPYPPSHGAPPPPPGPAPRGAFVAQPPFVPAIDPSARTHDGFFFHLRVGPSGFATGTEIGGDDIQISGGGANLALAFGGALTPKLILFGELLANVASAPTLSINGNESTASSDVAAGYVGIGPGLAYYFSSNLYLATTFTASSLSLQEDGEQIGESGTGLGVSARVGKEWWVSPQWGIGVVGEIFGASHPDGPLDWSTAGLAIGFSATCN